MEMTRRGLRFVRYDDDFSIYCNSNKEARNIGNSVYLYLRDKLKLPINREKSGIRRPLGFSILGYALVSSYQKGSRNKYQFVAEKKRLETLKKKIKEITRKTAPISFNIRIQRLKQVCRGWINHFKYANILRKLKDLDGWIRNRIRYCIWHDWKRPERKRKNLIRLGVEKETAYQ